MEFQLPYYKQFKKNLTEIANRFSLNPDNLKIEFFTPNCQAILEEQIGDDKFKIHISLEEDRIISFRRISDSGDYPEHIRAKYRRYMK